MTRFRNEGAGGQPPDPVLLPLSVADAAHLVRLAERAASARGLQVTYDGVGALVTDDGMVAGLTNLARTVSGHRRRQWREIVASHFEQLAGNLAQPPPLPADLENELYLRLVATSGVPPEWAGSAREFVPGVLCVAATPAERAVAMHLHADDLGLTPEEVDRIGLTNLRRLRDQVEYLEHRGAEVAALRGGLFTASRALVLDSVLRESLRVENPAYGVLVAMPVRDLLLVHVLRDATVVPAIDLMVSAAVRSFDQQPGPVSPHVYYVADGEWQQITAFVGGEIRIIVDGPLADAAHRLGLL